MTPAEPDRAPSERAQPAAGVEKENPRLNGMSGEAEEDEAIEHGPAWPASTCEASAGANLDALHIPVMSGKGLFCNAALPLGPV
jgi:hypothetical protein